MADIRITPASSIMAFTSSLSFKETLTQDASGSIVLNGSGSTGRTNVFAIDGGSGRLFSVDDDLSDSLFSVNTIAGLPVIEAFANNTVNIGKYGAYSFVATGSGDARIGSGSVMFVSASGVVGIGTTSPSNTLQVVGGVTATSFTGSFSGSAAAPGSTTQVLYNNGGAIAAASNFVFSGSNVGIGVTNPGSTLVVQKNTAGGRGGELSIVNYAASTVGNESALNFGIEASTYAADDGNFQIKAYLNNINGATDAIFSNWSGTAFLERMRITSAGNVGIGTTTPGSKLQVGGSSGAVATPTAIQMDGTYKSSPASFDSLKFYLYKDATESYGFGLGDIADLQYWAGSSSGGMHRFFTSQTERMRITSAGLVGIGITTPQAPLSFANAVGNKIDFYHSTVSTGDRYGIQVQYDQLIIHSGAAGLSTGGILLGKSTTSTFTEAMRITNGGNVGIGTTNPGNKLTVLGSNNTTPVAIGAGSNATFEFKGNSTSGYTSTFNINDTALYIGHNSSGRNLVLQTNSTDRLTVGGTGTIKFNAYGAGSITGTATYNLAVDSSGNIIEVAAGGITGTGTTNYIPKFTSSTAVGNSIIYQSGSGAIGIGTSAPVNSISTSTERSLTIKGSSYGSLYLQAGSTNFRWWTSTSALFLSNLTTSTDVIVVDSTNNYVGIKNSSAAYELDVNGSIRASSNVYVGTAGVYLYSEAVAGSAELKVIDAASNITTLSPHNFSLIPEGPSEDLAWSYYSENKGKKINVDMLKLARILEKLTGEKLVYIEE